MARPPGRPTSQGGKPRSLPRGGAAKFVVGAKPDAGGAVRPTVGVKDPAGAVQDCIARRHPAGRAERGRARLRRTSGTGEKRPGSGPARGGTVTPGVRFSDASRGVALGPAGSRSLRRVPVADRLQRWETFRNSRGFGPPHRLAGSPPGKAAPSARAGFGGAFRKSGRRWRSHSGQPGCVARRSGRAPGGDRPRSSAQGYPSSMPPVYGPLGCPGMPCPRGHERAACALQAPRPGGSPRGEQPRRARRERHERV